MIGRRKLPPPLDLDWPMKAWEDAELELRYERGHMIMTIEHETVRGVTPAMLDWWFRHIGGEMAVERLRRRMTREASRSPHSWRVAAV